MFLNRQDAAQRLASKLQRKALVDPVVVGIPRGGVVTASVLAEELDADLDIVLTRKIPAPLQPEVALGAVTESGQVYLNNRFANVIEQSPDYVRREVRRQLDEIARRRRQWRAVRRPTVLAGRTVIVADDGVATGATMTAALRALRPQQPEKIIVAVPVASPEALEELRPWCDEIVCLSAPAAFESVGQFYRDFSAVEEEVVADLLRQAAQRRAPAGAAGRCGEGSCPRG